MQAAELRDQLVARAEVKVVGVAEDDLRADLPQLVRVEALHGSLGADGHERGRRDLAVGGAQDPCAGGAVAGLDLESAGRRGAHTREGASYTTSMASPNE